eukprot:TRINITY_DN6507_c0_g2_i1.p1 TRINITY_DN6507_c0_g2~~TRINITY_DN6507_c0_g2_i1.p1  ORF type:complete len:161 (+),score=54.79 TRINITY_DN6507_c0_g2_i1:68-484(+)
MLAVRRAAAVAARSGYKPAAFQAARGFPTIVNGVDFETIAREWRCKWSTDNDKKSLEELQKLLGSQLATIKAVDGVKGVQRIVCGGCQDFKVITALPVDKYKAWAEGGHAPESEFLAAMNKIDGVSVVETQTYTIEPM